MVKIDPHEKRIQPERPKKLMRRESIKPVRSSKSFIIKCSFCYAIITMLELAH